LPLSSRIVREKKILEDKQLLLSCKSYELFGTVSSGKQEEKIENAVPKALFS
jgi:hypothetical protein